MRLETIHARSFGPFTDRTLVLAPGLTVIHGPNESGKSTWHSAIYFGLCGMRRARGSPRGDERDYAERHRPWKAEAWEVGAVVALDDGRRIELRHDLEGRVDCRATDAALGRDVSAEIMYEGAPDGSRFLGLDRRAFLATACIRQAELLGITQQGGLLQEHLQRAAASARSDGTAAAAIARLVEFHKEQVGQTRTNSTKPLRRALDRLEAAQEALRAAADDHRAYCQLVARADELRADAASTRDRLRAMRALVAAREAESWSVRVERAHELGARFAAGPPASRSDDDDLAAAVESALRAFADRPIVVDLGGTSATEIRDRIAALPQVPAGDRAPDPLVLSARKDYAETRHALELHEADRPAPVKQPATGGASEDTLRDLARDLELETPAIDPVLGERVTQAEQHLADLAEQPRRRGVLIAGVAAALAGASAIGFGMTIAGLVMLAVAGIALIVWMLMRTGPQARINALTELRIAEDALGAEKHAAADVARRRAAAETAVAARGLSAIPADLRGLARELADAAQAARDHERWTVRHRHLLTACSATEARLAAELERRGVTVSGRASDAAAGYLTSCADRTRIAAEAARRADFERELAAREAAEQAVADARERRRRAEQTLQDVAARCGAAAACTRPEDAETIAAALREWQATRTASIAADERRRAEWVELETLLAGDTLEALAAKDAELAAEAARLRALVDPALLEHTADVASDAAALQREADDAAREAALAEGALAGRGRELASVAEAEEEAAAAAADLERLRRLEQTLNVTRDFLSRAQERVHRDIAPVLAETVRRWIGRVTGGRYVDALVDPHSLEVRVRSATGEWREATRLSHGTTEQVYLLLRMALARHLARPGERCPLILDDVTVQSDRARTLAILGVLQAISREHQVVLFSQEDDVLTWAEHTLQEPTDRLERLEPVPVAS